MWWLRACLVFGTVVSAVFVQYASYKWIFWFTTLAAVPSALLAAILIPSQKDDAKNHTEAVKSRMANVRRLDLVGVSVLTGEVDVRMSLTSS